MWEDIYQIYQKWGADGTPDLRASDMTLCDAILFIKAIFEDAYKDGDLILEIRKQPMDYGKQREKNI